jgi:hypothetical protein
MTELESAKYWLDWIERGGRIALLLVAIGVGYEFIEGMLASPLRKKIEDARQTEIAQLRNHAAEADLEIAKAKERAEAARLETAKIEKEYGPRHLTQGQLASLAEKALTFSGMTFTFTVHTNDTESANFGLQIVSVLKAVGWTVNWNIFQSFEIRTGLRLTVGNDEDSARAGQMLKTELHEDGFAVEDAGSISIPKTLQLEIDPRPLPSFTAR